LEDLLSQGARVPFSNKIIVDEEPLLNIIDQMRVSIPEEIKQAKRIQQEREKEIARGREEAAQIIAQAREEAARILDEHEIRQAAEAQADRILERARLEAQDISKGAADYAAQVLRELAEHLSKLQIVVNNGLKSLERQRFHETAVSSSPSQVTPDPDSDTTSGS